MSEYIIVVKVNGDKTYAKFLRTLRSLINMFKKVEIVEAGAK